MTHATYTAFGGDDMLVASYDHWAVLSRPAQVTKGAMVLIAKADVTSYSALPPEAFAEMGKVITDIESTLAATLRPDKMNYLMLMMVDPHVHYHVIPRYGPDHELADPGWPGPPALGETVDSDAGEMRDFLKSAWVSS